jgi:hypothetical protein
MVMPPYSLKERIAAESIANACGDWHVCLEYKGSSTGSWTVFLALVMLKGFIEHHT